MSIWCKLECPACHPHPTPSLPPSWSWKAPEEHQAWASSENSITAASGSQSMDETSLRNGSLLYTPQVPKPRREAGACRQLVIRHRPYPWVQQSSRHQQIFPRWTFVIQSRFTVTNLKTGHKQAVTQKALFIGMRWGLVVLYQWQLGLEVRDGEKKLQAGISPLLFGDNPLFYGLCLYSILQFTKCMK